MRDIIDLVSITPATVRRWSDLARTVALAMSPSIPVEDIGVEQAFAQSDGTLLVSCPIVGREPLTMTVPASEWVWAHNSN